MLQAARLLFDLSLVWTRPQLRKVFLPSFRESLSEMFQLEEEEEKTLPIEYKNGSHH